MLGGVHFQNAFVTRDIATYAARFEALHGMTLPVRDAGARVQTPEGEREVRAKVALGWHGGLEFELIEPIGGHVDFYREVLGADDRPYFHHLGYQVRDWDAALARVRAADLPIVAQGEVASIKFAYFDTRALVGHYSEFIYKPDDMWPAHLR